MRKVLWLSTVIFVCFGALQAAPDSDSGKPQYTSDNKLLAPKNFRQWIFLSSGLGMSYSPQGADHLMFTNVFVPQWAYSEFLKSGKGGAFSNGSDGLWRGSERLDSLPGEVGLF